MENVGARYLLIVYVTDPNTGTPAVHRKIITAIDYTDAKYRCKKWADNFKFLGLKIDRTGVADAISAPVGTPEEH